MARNLYFRIRQPVKSKCEVHFSHRCHFVLFTGHKYPENCRSSLGEPAGRTDVGGCLAEVELEVLGQEGEETDQPEEEEDGRTQVEHPHPVGQQSSGHRQQLPKPLLGSFGLVQRLLPLQLLGIPRAIKLNLQHFLASIKENGSLRVFDGQPFREEAEEGPEKNQGNADDQKPDPPGPDPAGIRVVVIWRVGRICIRLEMGRSGKGYCMLVFFDFLKRSYLQNDRSKYRSQSRSYHSGGQYPSQPTYAHPCKNEKSKKVSVISTQFEEKDNNVVHQTNGALFYLSGLLDFSELSSTYGRPKE